MRLKKKKRTVSGDFCVTAVSLKIRLLLLSEIRALEGKKTERDRGRMKDFLSPLIMLGQQKS